MNNFTTKVIVAIIAFVGVVHLDENPNCGKPLGNVFSVNDSIANAPSCTREGSTPHKAALGLVGGSAPCSCNSSFVMKALTQMTDLKPADVYGVNCQVVAGMIFQYFAHLQNDCCRVSIWRKVDGTHELLNEKFCCDRNSTCNKLTTPCDEVNNDKQ